MYVLCLSGFAFMASPAAAATLAGADPFSASGSLIGQSSLSSPYAEAVLADHPTLYYRLDETEGPTAFDSSGNGLNGAYGENVEYGVAGALLDDSDTAVSKSTNCGTGACSPILSQSGEQLPAGNGARTLEAWFKAGGQGRYSAYNIFEYGDVAGGHGFTVTITFKGTIAVSARSASVSATPSTGVLDEKWHLLDVTYDGNNVEIYLDGQIVGGGYLGPAETVTPGQGFQMRPLPGVFSLDEVALYPTALSAARVDAHWTAGQGEPAQSCASIPSGAYPSAVLADDPTVYYRLDELAAHPEERVAFDSSGHCLNATYSNEDKTETGVLSSETDTAVSKFIGAGNETLVSQSGDQLPSGNSPRTIEMWVKGPFVNRYEDGELLRYGDIADGHGFEVYTLENNELVVEAGSSTVSAVATSNIVGDGKWHLIDVTYDGSNVEMYLDGQIIGGGTLGATETVTPGQGLQIRGHSYGDAGVADVAIYPSALTPEQVDAHWTAGASPPKHSACASKPAGPYPAAILADKPLVYYRLDELAENPEAQVALDSSGHCSNATYGPEVKTETGALPGDDDTAVAKFIGAGEETLLSQSGDTLPSGNSPRTIEMWVKGPFVSRYETGELLRYGDVAGEHGFQVYTIENTELAVSDGSSTVTATATSNIVGDGKWHMVDVTYDGSNVEMYLDGQPIGGGPLGAAETVTPGQGMKVKGHSYGNAAVDEVAIYGAALSAKQILAHYNASKTNKRVANTTSLLRGVACPSGSDTCLSVGTSTGGEGTVVPITSAGVPSVPATVPKSTQLNAIACLTTSASCYAVGTSTTGEGTVVPVSSSGAPGTPLPVPGTSTLDGVACRSDGTCFAVGVGTGSQGVVVPIASGRPDTPDEVANTTKLLGVTCRNRCIAVGYGPKAGVIVNIQPPTVVGPALEVPGYPGASYVTAVDCPSAVTCEAVGENYKGEGVSVPITNGTPNEAQEAPESGLLDGVYCVAVRACIATGEGVNALSAATVGAVAITAGSEQPIPLASTVYGIACVSASTCWGVGQTVDRANGLIVKIGKIKEVSLNERNQWCGPTAHRNERFDAVSDEFFSPPDAVSLKATIGPAAVCRGAEYPPSSWIMLAESGETFVQTGIFYNSDGTDDPFVEVEYVDPATGKRVGTPNYNKGQSDGFIQKPETTGSIEIFALGQISKGTFSLFARVRPPGYNAQCPWVTKAGKRSAYEPLQGDTDLTDRRLEVEAKLGEHCLWIYYMPEGTSFPYANLAGGEIHDLHDKVPGTYSKPLTFTHVEVEYGGQWQNFVSDRSGTTGNPLNPPVPNYKPPKVMNVGCQSYIPYSGSEYAFDTWSENESGLCAPWSIEP